MPTVWPKCPAWMLSGSCRGGAGDLEHPLQADGSKQLVDLRHDLEDRMRGLCNERGMLLDSAGLTNLPRKVSAVALESSDVQGTFVRYSSRSPIYRANKYDREVLSIAAEVRDRAVRMALDHAGEHPSRAGRR